MSGWNRAKVDAFSSAFYDFLDVAPVDSKDLGGGTILGRHLFRAQRMFLDTVWDALADDIHEIYVLKSRQLGLSTITRALSVFWIGMHEGLRGGVVFDTAFNSQQARKEILAMLRGLPRRFSFPRVREDNRDNLILENGSTLLFLSAGRNQGRSGGSLGRSVGLNFAHVSEVSSFVNEEGLISFQQSLSKVFDNRLYIWESTARGYNVWHGLYQDAKADDLGKRTVFIGWWAKDNQELQAGTPEYERYAEAPPTKRERDRIQAVEAEYGWKITKGQLAWYRKLVDPGQDGDEDKDGDDPVLTQEQPWCVAGDTRVGTARGLLPIRELAAEDVTTLGVTSHAGPTGIAPLWRACTKLGYEVVGTANHPLITVDGSEIELSGSQGKKIQLHPPRFSETPVSITWREGVIDHSVLISPMLARLIGIYMGDGSIQGGAKGHPSVFNVSIACDAKDEDFAEECRSLFRCLFGVPAGKIYHNPRGTGGWITVRASSRLVLETFRKLGLVRNDTGPTQRKIHVPEFIFRSPKEVVKEFLSGVFETDGFTDSQSLRCVLFSKYEQFLKDIQLLLLGFGITSRRRSVQKKSPNNHFYIGHELHLRATETRRFHEKIGFLSARKRARATEQLKRVWAHEIEFSDAVDVVEETDRIEPVYNLTVEGKHWFDANGIVTHNTEPEAWQQTGSAFFQPESLTRAANRIASEPPPQRYRFWPGDNYISCQILPERVRRNTDLWVWEEPVPQAQYVISGDPAFGRDEKNNYSAVQVLRCYADGVDQVAEYASALCPPHHFSWLLLALVAWYGGTQPGAKALMICELNGPGEEVWRQYQATLLIVQRGYLRQEAEARGISDIYANARSYIYQRSDSMTSGNQYQFKTNAQLKVQIMEAARNYMQSGTIVVNSMPLLEEMRSISRDGDVIGAEGRNRDDRTFALAMGIRAWEEKIRRGQIMRNQTRQAERARASMSMADQRMLFDRYMLSDFFAQKERARLQMTRAMRAGAARHASRQPIQRRR
jgi:hypothetical protein